MSTTKLPFVELPAAPATKRVGDVSTGILEIPVYGDFLVGETSYIEERMSQFESLTVRAAQVAEVIANRESITIGEAYAVVERSLLGQLESDQDRLLGARYAADIAGLETLFAVTGRHRVDATVTAILRYRLNPEWTEEDTGRLTRRQREVIYQFAEEERIGIEAAPMTDEELTEAAKGESKAKKPTGGASTGN